MGDMKEEYDAYKMAKKDKKIQNRISSMDILKENNIRFIEKNNGVHLIVIIKDEVINFYPSTGLWFTNRKPKDKKRGVLKLVRLVEKLRGEDNEK